MIKAIEQKMLSQNAQAVKYLNVVLQGANQSINNQIDRDFGLVGPMSLSTPSPSIHVARWAFARELFVVETNAKRVHKEIVAAGISQVNKCIYCEEVHGTSIKSTGAHSTAKAISDGTWPDLKDEKTKSYIHWSLNSLNPNATIIQQPPFSQEEAPEIIGTALIFHSTNRLVSIFLEDSPMPSIFSGRIMKKMALNIASKTLFKSMISKKVLAGDAMPFIPEVEAKSLAWAKANSFYSTIQAYEDTVVLEIEKNVPAKLVNRFRNHIDQWKGEPMPFGLSWLTEILDDFPEKEKPMVKLAFLAAYSPYRISEADIQNFRQIRASDQELLEICFWAIQIITARIGSWLIQPFKIKS